jgi:hypothetical protein
MSNLNVNQPVVQQHVAPQQHAADPARRPPTAHPALNHLAGHHAASKARHEAAGPAQLTSLQVFQDLAGAGKEPTFKQKELKTAAKTTVQERSGNTRRRQIVPIKVAIEEEEDLPIKAAANDTINTLLSGGRDGLKKKLNQGYDPLEQYALLHNAMCDVQRDA